MRYRILLAVAVGLSACAPRSNILPAQPPASEQWYFWTDDRVRHYALDLGTARGPGDTIVVLHGGWGAEHSYLVDAVAPLADRYRFVLYDQRGSLRTPAPDSLIHLDRLVDDLEHLRGSLGLQQLTLVAHSMGNALAYAYLARFPERVRGLVLVGPVLPTTFGSMPNMVFVRQVWPDADADELRHAAEEFMRDAARRTRDILLAEGLLPDSLRHVPPDQLDIMGGLQDRDRTRAWRISFTAVNTCGGENWREMKGGQIYYSQQAANAILRHPSFTQRLPEFWPALRNFEGPVRVIIGSCDYVDVGPRVWPHVVRHLQNGGIDIVEGSGHTLWLDRPDAFTAALDAALTAMR